MSLLSKQSKWTNPPKGGWTAQTLIKYLQKLDPKTPVYVLAHTDCGPHSSFGAIYEPQELNDNIYDTVPGPLVLLD